MKWRNAALLVALTTLVGCATTSMSRVSADNAVREQLLAAAAAGDADAQFQLGNSYCCGSGFYNTAEAVRWWCRAAAQDHVQALAALSARRTQITDADCSRRVARDADDQQDSSSN